MHALQRNTMGCRLRTLGLAVGALVLAVLCASIALAANPTAVGLAQTAPGAYHTCALTARGGVQCWGWNGRGQLGTGNFNDSEVTVDVAGLTSGAVAVASGDMHSCALMANGTVRCWGDNFYGQAGITDGLPAYWLTQPTEVPGLTGVVALTAGQIHTCVLTAAGGVKCWGNNNFGQLGNGGIGQGPVVVEVTGLASGVVALEGGLRHTCAVTAGGGAKCWGSNDRGQLGNGSTADAFTPVGVVGLAGGVVAIAAGSRHSCAVVAGGNVKCWGDNSGGQLGDGSTNDASTPVDVIGLNSPVAMLALGNDHSCALASAGSVRCWGWNNLGQLGDGTTANAVQPSPVLGLAGGIASLAAFSYHTCAIVAGGTARCWGANSDGQLGNGASGRVRSPVDVVDLGSVATVATGTDHSCAQLGSGVVKCWGRNFVGQLGNGGTEDSFLPVDVDFPIPMSMLRAGGHSTCAYSLDDRFLCWGGLAGGQGSPAEVPGLGNDVVDVAIGGGHACALTSAGGVKCWGFNGYGQLGNGTMVDSAVATDVVGLTGNVAAIGAGAFHSCAVMNDRSVRCWGYNDAGQLGIPAGGNQLTPVSVAALVEGAFTVDGGDSHTCVQTTAFLMKCWGANGYAQLGLGNTHHLPGIHTVPLPTGTLELATGAFHSCQRGNGGMLRCWGRNADGEAAVPPSPGATPVVKSPVVVPGIAGATWLASAGQHTCAVVGGGVKCWGWNYYGQIGNGTGGYATVPQTVLAGLCGGFADVIAGNPFCASVEWNRNRLVTVGCLPGLFCTMPPVSRDAMAAFMNRTGSVFAPEVVARQAPSGALDLGSAPVVCITDQVPAVDYPRRAFVDGVLRAQAGADLDFTLRTAWSVDGGANWWLASTWPTRIFAKAGAWSNAVAKGSVILAAGGTAMFGLLVGREGSPGGATITDSNCNLRVRLDNHNGSGTPY